MKNKRTFYSNRMNRKSPRRTLLIIALIIILIIALSVFIIITQKSENNNTQPVETQNSKTQTQNSPNDNNIQTLPNLQSVVDGWSNTNQGIHAVKITDVSGNNLAELNGNKQFFTASMYKLFVVYNAYLLIDQGKLNPDEIYLNGMTRLQCLDAAIRSSDSACGEKLWNEIGKQNTTSLMSSYGLRDTSLTALMTTANDVAIILGRLERGDDLSTDSRLRFLDSLKNQDQIYRRGLPSGFNNATVFNKVGWNENIDWHDGAIVKLNDGRTIIMTVFSENTGYTNIAQLSGMVEEALK